MLQSTINNSFKADVLDLAPLIIAVHDTDHNIVWANKAFQKATGKSQEEIEGEKCYVIRNLSRPCHGCPILTAIETGEEQEAELTPENQDHRPVTRGSWLSRATPLRDADGTIIGAIETTLEITKQKQYETMLKWSEREKTAILDAMSELVAYQDLEHTVLWTNRAAAESANEEQERLIGRKCFEIWAGREEQCDICPVAKAIETGSIQRNKITTYDGKIWNITGYPIKNETGEIIGVVEVTGDISKMVQAEEEQRDLQNMLQIVLDTIPSGVFWKDRDSIYHGCNRTWLAWAGLKSSEEVIGKNDYELPWSKDEADSFREDDKRVMESGIPEHDIIEHYFRANGTRAWARTNKVPLRDKEGNIIGILGTSEDITERKRMEEEILKAEKLESLGIFAGGIAHDFNNILTMILGNVSMAKDQADPKSEILELLSETETASKRAQTLTKQLLTFAKGGTPVKETASFGDIIKESSLFVIHGSKSGCEFSIAEDLWPVEVDVGLISQVISNIVINANQAMPEGGIIKIKAENLIIDEGNECQIKPGRYVWMSVKDEGIGIAEKHLSKIFDPYFTTKQEGSGLGLATAYSIIKRHGGIIMAESLLGLGTTFLIYLPASEKAAPEKRESKVIKGQGRILVMDDEELLRKIVGRMLEKLDYKPGFAKDGVEAIGMYKAAEESGDPYDAVILDLTIPGGMGGKDAIKKLLEIDPEVKAIVSSGYSDDPILSNFQEYGFKGMIPKPFEYQSLSKVLYEVLKGEKV